MHILLSAVNSLCIQTYLDVNDILQYINKNKEQMYSCNCKELPVINNVQYP